MQSDEIRRRFLKFFEKRGHKIIPSASLVTTDERGITNPTLFNTAGMQPLIPYLLGKPHSLGNRLVDVQKCVRTIDIDDIGDKTHATFFEMLGNWSLGDPEKPDGIGEGYFKEEAIKWSYELLTNGEDKPEGDKGFGLDPSRLYVTVFDGSTSSPQEGNENIPKDTEAFEIWKKYIPENRIYFLGAKSNWWEAGDNGPCGPDSEMYYDITEKGLGNLSKEEFLKADEKREVVEVWNDVFMQYEKKGGKIIGKLKANNVDTGAGLERLAMVTQGVDNIYDTDLLKSVMEKINEFSKTDDLRAKRIVADHIRTSVFLISDGVVPSNRDRGYVLRKLLRRAQYNFNNKLGGEVTLLILAQSVLDIYKDTKYIFDKKNVEKVITEEEARSRIALSLGNKLLMEIVEKEGKISSENAFLLYSTYGYPFELIQDIANDNQVIIDEAGFQEKKKKHQELSRVGAEQKFKGGLAGTGEIETKYHTATHLLNASLRKVLGEHVFQKGSNITAERLRFDFSHPKKLTDEEKKKVEDLVNEKIKENLPVIREEMGKEEAKKSGAIGVFGDKYGDTVSIYTVGDSNGDYFSKEFCGGPHVSNTGVLGHFKITKEEAVSEGVRRIKAILEQ